MATTRKSRARRRRRWSRPTRLFLARRLWAFRQERGIAQRDLGRRTHLSGKFIGEVEHGQKSIALDNLYRMAVALELPLRLLTDIPTEHQCAAWGAEHPRLFAIVCCQPGRRQRERARRILETIF